MNIPNIEAIWDSFVEAFPYSEKHFDTVVGCCRRNSINPRIFANNLFYITGQRVNPNQEIIEPTRSLRELLKYIPPAYPLTFVAAFPDVVLWFMNNYDTEAYSENIYFLVIKNNQTKYFDKEMNVSSNFILMLVVAFIKSKGDIKFECSF